MWNGTARQQVILDAIEDEGGLWAVFITIDLFVRERPQLVQIFFSEEEAVELANDCAAWVRWAWSYQRQVAFIEGSLDSALAEVYESMPHPKAYVKKIPIFGLIYSVLRIR